MILVLEGCRAKIDQPDLRVQQDLSLAGLAVAVVGTGRWYLPIVREGLVLVVAQEDVLGLQIRVDQVEIMEDCVELA
jgi:hypothetical protein